jgi:hypothetical protein
LHAASWGKCVHEPVCTIFLVEPVAEFRTDIGHPIARVRTKALVAYRTVESFGIPTLQNHVTVWKPPPPRGRRFCGGPSMAEVKTQPVAATIVDDVVVELRTDQMRKTWPMCVRADAATRVVAV